MRVIIGCEYSGVVRRAFRAHGHQAWSCDLLPADDGSPFHIQRDIREIIHRVPWDLGIFHPPCTKLTRAGARWWSEPGHKQEQDEALEFVQFLMDLPIDRIAIENPPGAIGTRIRPADQYIQPWEFGHPEKKMTGLWLKGLPKLVPTNNVKAQMLALPLKEQNRIHYAAPGPDRWKERSRTYSGIAEAFADQWGRT